MTGVSKRKYRRRSEEERIRELEGKIDEIQKRSKEREQQSLLKERRESSVLKEIPRVRKRLKQFSQLAMDNGRLDIANSVTAFLVSLDRIYDAEVTREVHWSAPLVEDADTF